MATVVLWDIDGTLVRSSGGRVSVNAFLRALSLASGLPDALPYPKDAGGKTDEQIALEVLGLASIAEDRATQLLPAFRDAYLTPGGRARPSHPGPAGAARRAASTGVDYETSGCVSRC